jgi:hypothetical protein
MCRAKFEMTKLQIINLEASYRISSAIIWTPQFQEQLDGDKLPRWYSDNPEHQLLTQSLWNNILSLLQCPDDCASFVTTNPSPNIWHVRIRRPFWPTLDSVEFGILLALPRGKSLTVFLTNGTMSLALSEVILRYQCLV